MTVMFTLGSVRAERSPYSEDYYNQIWCEKQGGVAEFRLPDGKRVDCLLDDYAVEADWANYKSYEAIGQSLYYAKETNRIPAILLLIKDDDGYDWVNLVCNTMSNYNIKFKLFVVIAHERFKSE